ncbi:MAG: hypothetical protein DCC71_22535 [Proteobacteria bacterium]|nr:MAG: hypothetical protein DCC71_22535 [Pseudomonadota bacterium]
MRGRAQQRRGDRVEQGEALLDRVRGRRLGRRRQERRERGQHAREHPAFGSDRGAERPGVEPAEEIAQHASPRQERRCAGLLDAARAQHAPSREAGARDRLLGDRRLPDPGRAGDQRQAAMSALPLANPADERCDLGVAPDEDPPPRTPFTAIERLLGGSRRCRRGSVRAVSHSLHGRGVYGMQDWFFIEARRFAAEALGLDGAAIERAARSGAAGSDRLAALGAVVDALAAASGLDRATLLRRFGATLFGRLAALFPVFFVGERSALDFLAGFERQVHDELRRLDPRLDPPRIECLRPSADRVELVYRSPRGLGDLAHGLVAGCIAWFGDDLELERREDAATGALHFVVSERAAFAARG